MKFATALVLMVVLAAIPGCLCAQDTAGKSPEGGPKAASGKCSIKRTILPDGTVEVQNEDCSISRASKGQMLMPPIGKSASGESAAGPAETKETSSKESTMVGKLREMKPAALPADETDPKLRAKYLEAMNGYFDYYIAGYVHRQKVFDWQLFSSKVIFLLVTLLVASGVYFAALQFHEGMRRRAESPKAAPPADAASSEKSVTRADDSTVTTFSASTTGISVSSPVLGVVILVISLAFFYLYLVYVYPITELF